MQCKDCVYFKRCVGLGVELNMERNKKAEENCLQFTRASDFSDVVRCENCMRCYKKRTKGNKQLMYICMRMDGNEYQVNANDFCSYGKRGN